jgi:hypothetical protein
VYVLLEIVRLRIPDIGSIEERAQKEQRQHWQDPNAHVSFVFRSIGRRIPEIQLPKQSASQGGAFFTRQLIGTRRRVHATGIFEILAMLESILLA